MLPVKVIGGTFGTDDINDYRYRNFETEDLELSIG